MHPSYSNVINFLTIIILRIDERFLILVFGVCSMIVGNVFFMPLPNNENTHICPSETNSSVFRLISPLGKNVPCGDVEKGCCSLDWCKEQPAMNVVQFVIGFCIIAAGHPFRVSLTQSLLTKILGPVQQVRQINKSKILTVLFLVIIISEVLLHISIQ